MENIQLYESSEKIFDFPIKQLKNSLNEMVENAQSKTGISG